MIIKNYNLLVVLSLSSKYRLLTSISCTDPAVAVTLKILPCTSCMPCSKLSGFLEILFLLWRIERNVINGFRCWTACKILCRGPLQQVLLEEPIFVGDFLMCGSIAPSGERALCSSVVLEPVPKTLVLSILLFQKYFSVC